MAPTMPLSFRWEESFVARIDAVRGDVPRSVFVRRVVEEALGAMDEGLDRPAPPRPPLVKDLSGRSLLADRQAALNQSKGK